MGLGKNKKKQWRKCVPEIEDEIQKANQVNEIDDISFEISNKAATGKGKDMKYSTVPRRVVKRPNVKLLAKDTVDLWVDGAVKPELSKRRQKLLNGMKRYESEDRVAHPGSSYRPTESDHSDLLTRVALSEAERERGELKAERWLTIKDDEEAAAAVMVEDADSDREDPGVPVTKPRPAATRTMKEKKRRLGNVSREKAMVEQKREQKREAHLLRNIPQIRQSMRAQERAETVRREVRERRSREVREHKHEMKAVEREAFVLPTEVPSCLRRLVPDTAVFSEMTLGLEAHKFKVEHRKKRAQKMLTKSIKKTGLAV